MSLIRTTAFAVLLTGSVGAGLAAPQELRSSQLAYCEMRRICTSQCVERAYGRHGVYCVRWGYVCRTVCEPGPYYHPYHHPWRHGYWW